MSESNLFARIAAVEKMMREEIDRSTAEMRGAELHMYAFHKGRAAAFQNALMMLKELCWVGEPVPALEDDHA